MEEPAEGEGRDYEDRQCGILWRKREEAYSVHAFVMYYTCFQPVLYMTGLFILYYFSLFLLLPSPLLTQVQLFVLVNYECIIVSLNGF